MKKSALLAISILLLNIDVSYADTSLIYSRDSVDEKKQAELEQKLCDSGDANACRSLGNRYDESRPILSIGSVPNQLELRGVNADNTKAIATYQKACDLGDFGGCADLGHLYRLSRDEAKAIVYFEKACNANEEYSCHNLAHIYSKSNNHSKSIPLFQKACDLGYPDSCFNIAVSYSAGIDGVKQDHQKAAVLFQKACNVKTPSSDCTVLKAALKEACDKKGGDDCITIDTIYKTGKIE
jgi:TPR repeat protein